MSSSDRDGSARIRIPFFALSGPLEPCRIELLSWTRRAAATLDAAGATEVKTNGAMYETSNELVLPMGWLG
jgi:hypothetical protein